MILGGKPLGSCDIVSYAKSLGVYTIVTDYLDPSHSPAKEIADESWMISTADLDTLEKMVRLREIDGIFAGIHEFNIKKMIQLCSRLDFPCYCTQEQWDICSDKKKFKDLCKAHNVPVPEEYPIDSQNKSSALNQVKYPVIVKPIDGSSGDSISICNTEKELQTALDNPDGKQFIVEHYYKTGKEATIFYILQDGKIMLSAMADRHIKYSQDGVIPLPVGYIYPSKYLTGYIDHLNERVTEMFHSIGLTDGMIFMQAVVDEGNCVFYEMGFRLTGSLEYHILADICGFNPLESMTHYALTGRMSNIDLSPLVNPAFSKYACNVTFLVKIGVIGQIIGLEAISGIPGVISVTPSYFEGDEVPQSAYGTLRQVILRVNAAADTKPELKEIMDQILNTFRVYSDTGEDMLLPVFDTMEVLDSEISGLPQNDLVKTAEAHLCTQDSQNTISGELK